MYVPIDATMPEERVQLILKTLNPFALLDARNAKSESSSETDSLIPVDGILDETKVNQELLDEVRANHIDVDPLYSIFTSSIFSSIAKSSSKDRLFSIPPPILNTWP